MRCIIYLVRTQIIIFDIKMVLFDLLRGKRGRSVKPGIENLIK